MGDDNEMTDPIMFEDIEGIEMIQPTMASDIIAVPKDTMTFQIGCKYRNFCSNWKKQLVKNCIYCRRNRFHLTPKDGFGLEDNYQSTVPGISIL